MHSMILWSVGLTVLCASSAFAGPARCPHTDGDACSEWRFGQADKELAALIAGPSDWIERMPPQSRDAARAALVEAQAQWIKFRDAECHRQRTWSHASAMTPRGLMASCQLNLTFHRRNELEKLYTFKPQ